ncbi:MAG: hypothetical protein ACTSRI_14330 [Promethearchaeota archaeon]
MLWYIWQSHFKNLLGKDVKGIKVEDLTDIELNDKDKYKGDIFDLDSF